MAVEILNDDADDGNQEIPVEKLDAAPENKAPAPDKDKPQRKFEGKTPEEIEAAYEALEQRFGSQGAELGELRKLTDGIIRSSLVEKQKDPAPKHDQEPSTTTDPDSEFFVNPRAAVRRMLEEDETIQELRKTQTLTQQERAQALLRKKHEDANTLIQDTEFQEWVKASPTRTKLLVQGTATSMLMLPTSCSRPSKSFAKCGPRKRPRASKATRLLRRRRKRRAPRAGPGVTPSPRRASPSTADARSWS